VDWPSGHLPWHLGVRLAVGPRVTPFNAFIDLEVGRVPFGPMMTTSATTVTFGLAANLPTVLGRCPRLPEHSRDPPHGLRQKVTA
jgi:hypothetical protein